MNYSAISRQFGIATILLAMLLSACEKKVEVELNNNPTVTGHTVHYAANDPEKDRLLTSPVVAAHENVLSLPAHIVWDEDYTSRIAPPIAGRFDEIIAQAGSKVNAKQVLAYLRSPELGIAQAESAKAQADLTQADNNLARIKALVEVNGAAGKDLEQAQGDVARAQAEASRTKLRLDMLGSGNVIDQRFTLRSSIAGVVVERNTNPGMEWRPDQPGAPLFVVSDPTYLWCWIDAPENALSMLHQGMKVTVHSSAWPQESFEARVDYVADGLDPVTRTVKVRARLRNPQRHLKGEMYVTAELSSKAQGTLDVPAKAVFLDHGEQYVFVKTSNQEFERRKIVPVASNEQWVSFTQGLNKSDQVVVDGALYLQKMLDNSVTPAPANVGPPTAPEARQPVKQQG